MRKLSKLNQLFVLILFVHLVFFFPFYSDDSGDEVDGYDETILPVDWKTAGNILDDELYNIFVIPMRKGVTATILMDSCYSATVLDLPYIYKPEVQTETTDMDIS